MNHGISLAASEDDKGCLCKLRYCVLPFYHSPASILVVLINFVISRMLLKLQGGFGLRRGSGEGSGNVLGRVRGRFWRGSEHGSRKVRGKVPDEVQEQVLAKFL